MRIRLYRYDAFTEVPGRGNPAGVVTDAVGLTEEQMQRIAAKAGYSETAFVLPSESADLRLRYFTPGQEVNLCGHATVGSLYCLKERGLLAADSFTVETKAGLLPMSVREIDGRNQICMQQADYQETAFCGSIKDLAESLGLEEAEIDTSLPIVYGCTGLWTLLVPISSLDSFRRMKPENSRFPQIFSEMPRSSVHPFCLQAEREGADLHARHFSSPYSGTIEDPVTGTASGVLGSYYRKHICRDPEKAGLLKIEQGLEIGKDGIVTVAASPYGEGPATIYGTAVFTEDYEITL